MQDHLLPQDHHSPRGLPAPLSRLPGTCAPRWDHSEEFISPSSTISPPRRLLVGSSRGGCQHSPRVDTCSGHPVPPIGPGEASRPRRHRESLFLPTEREDALSDPRTRSENKGVRPGAAAPPCPGTPGSSLRCPRPGGGAARDDGIGQGTPAPEPPPPRSHHSPYHRGDPPAAVSGSAPARPRGSRGVPHRPRRDSPGTRPRGSRRLRGKLQKLQRDRRGGRDQGDLGDRARGCGSNDLPNTPQSRVPATSGGGAHHPLLPARAPRAKPRVSGYRAPGPPDRPGRSRRRAPVRPVPPSPPASLSPATAADNKAAHEDVPRLRLGPSGPPDPALTCAAAGRAVQRGRAAARRCPRPGRPPTAPRSGYMAL
ncbi:PREDICTED: basic salivary proline-rich protein 2-like [Sturnus vulgaris]|uniref:basic salivary proline-rich protein 2-like n=1 Tax=Sturnus vulgaris TaxID=9172 RepID=UPI00071A8BC7|nr:PREDICTED: basic salivary proline-rich protein 2-like [Sturnus vulgaris]